MRITSSSGTVGLTACILALIGSQRAAAADFPVHATGDLAANGAALVAAIRAAMLTPEEDDRVLLDPGAHYLLANPDPTYPDSGLPLIDSGITILGGYNSNGELTTIERKMDAAPFRIMHIQPRIRYVKNTHCDGARYPLDLQPTVRLEYVRISKGDVGDAGGDDLHKGGGIYNQDGRLVLYRSDVNGNRADFGGGIANDSYTLKYQVGCSGVLESDFTFAGTASIQESSVRGNVGILSGGGILNDTVMNIDHSTINANEGDEHGGGILNGGSLEVAESTVSGNFNGGDRGGDAGAGIYQAAGSLTVTFSTVAFNQGSGIANVSSTLTTLSDTILAGNNALYEDGAGLLPLDCFGTFRSLGHNLIGAADPRSTCVVTASRNDQIGFDRAAPIDAKLAELAANGGFTQTHALKEGSPAIDHADSFSSVCPVDDQRGVIRRRIPGDACDIGAYEKVVPGSCGLDCTLWRVISVCENNPYSCEKFIVPKINELPQVPDCLLDGPGCLVPPPVDFQ